MNDLSNFNEIFRKDVPYNNFKSCKKLGFYPLLRRYNFEKTKRGGQTDPPPPPPPHPSSRFRVKFTQLNACNKKNQFASILLINLKAN